MCINDVKKNNKKMIKKLLILSRRLKIDLYKFKYNIKK
jgi:hypothetical protein